MWQSRTVPGKLPQVGQRCPKPSKKLVSLSTGWALGALLQPEQAKFLFLPHGQPDHLSVVWLDPIQAISLHLWVLVI